MTYSVRYDFMNGIDLKLEYQHIANVVGLVGSNPNMIGHVDASTVNDTVKFVATLK
jgi:hypothetical protein